MDAANYGLVIVSNWMASALGWSYYYAIHNPVLIVGGIYALWVADYFSRGGFNIKITKARRRHKLATVIVLVCGLGLLVPVAQRPKQFELKNFG